MIKLGHGGTLDSAASGVLGTAQLNRTIHIRCAHAVILTLVCLAVVGIGEGTKMLTSMLAGSKVDQSVFLFTMVYV